MWKAFLYPLRDKGAQSRQKRCEADRGSHTTSQLGEPETGKKEDLGVSLGVI